MRGVTQCMGINFGPPPAVNNTLASERNPFLPDSSDDPHVAKCSSCGRGYTVDQFSNCPQDENLTLCSSSGCKGEVVFI